MNNQEALKYLKATYGDGSTEFANLVNLKAIKPAIEALEKQIPQKAEEKIEVHPVYDGNGAYIDADMFVNLHCPSCGNWIGMKDEWCNVFCDRCGQAIDCSEEEGK